MKILVYCGIIRFLGGSIFVEFVGASNPRNNILHKLINQGNKVIFPFVGIQEYTKLRPHEPVKFHGMCVYVLNIFFFHFFIINIFYFQTNLFSIIMLLYPFLTQVYQILYHMLLKFSQISFQYLLKNNPIHLYIFKEFNYIPYHF